MSIAPVLRTFRNYSCALLGVLYFSSNPVWAAPVRGETSFEHEPVLVRADTDNDSPSYSNARYSFEVAVPQDSGAPLGGLTFVIPSGIVPPNADEVQVIDSTGQPVAFQENLLEQTAQLTFGKPVSPGQKVTVQFYPISNPQDGGSYLFDISALPAGNNPHPQFLSYGRLQFHDD